MKRLTAEFYINGFVLYNVHEVRIKSSWETLTDTATVSIPRKIKWKDGSVAGPDGLFKAGDPVTIKLGYDYDNKTIFEGYVTEILPGTPLTFECQDAAYLLKKKTFTKSYKSVSLKTLLADICPIPFTSVEANLGQFKISNCTVAQVLDELKKTYSLESYVRSGKLYVGLAYSGDGQNRVKFNFQDNVIQADDLKYRLEEDVKYRVKLISIQPNNTKIEVEVGDKDGEQRTLHYYNLPESELRRIGAEDIKKFKYTGYSGSFTAFGEPRTNQGDIAIISDEKYPERAGSYLVKSVETTFGRGGYRQEIELDRKAG